MKFFTIYVCDDMGNREYSRNIQCKTTSEAENKASSWAREVEANEGWFTTWEIMETMNC